MNSPPTARRAFLDPGWLFLVAGLGILGATILVPASRDLARARWQRDRAIAVERHRQDRLARYEEYLSALDSAEPALVLALAESQLNQIPADREAIPGRGRRTGGVSVFPGLEPAPLALPEYHPVESTLATWTASESIRPWLIVGGAVFVLVGLLPASRERPALPSAAPYA